MIRKYRKKPVEIEAVVWDGKDKTYLEIIDKWKPERQLTIEPVTRKLRIHTLEGTMEANIGDYIIKGVKGELYPCKPDIFEQTYEEVKPERMPEGADDYETFLDILLATFGQEPELWSCEYCYWLDCDERICKVCNELQKILEKIDKETKE